MQTRILFTVGLLLTAGLASSCGAPAEEQTTSTGASDVPPTPAPSSQEPSPAPTLTNLPPGDLPPSLVDEFGVAMVLIPEGIFTMGTNEDAADAHEKPAHDVYTDAVYMDTHETTNSLYQACVDAGACQSPVFISGYHDNPEFADYPAVRITWDMANQYCTWRGARLPTEAEWEKAARWDPVTGEVSTYPWGEEPPSGRYANTNAPDYGTTPIGSYDHGQSPLGLYDMSGNVWEWVSDAYTFDYYADSPSFNPTGPEEDTGSRVIRGGSYGDDDFYARTTARVGQNPSWQGALGVRCAKEP
jgi:formylglycine-generating enzyme required for sulfatase activity